MDHATMARQLVAENHFKVMMTIALISPLDGS